MTPLGQCRCCFIVPPYMLRKLAESDDAAVRDRAQATLRTMQRAHNMRTSLTHSLNITPVTAASPARKRRRVFDCEGTTDLSRTLALPEGGSLPADIAVREAYEYAGYTWDFFHKVLDRNSIDNRGMTIISSVHYSENGMGFDNAFWNGHQMVYGDGAEIFDRMTRCLDVVAHELTHGITQFAAGLPYENQSGALNEHFSDVFGVAVRQWHENQTDPETANWLIGDGLLLTGHALRSMKRPGSANPDDPQPSHMQDYHNVANDESHDWGGVHTNSGIPNRAFYLASVAIGRPIWEIAAKVWYITLTQRLRGETSFEKCAYETISVARDFFDDAIATKVAAAWVEVGVINPNTGSAVSLASTHASG